MSEAHVCEVLLCAVAVFKSFSFSCKVKRCRCVPSPCARQLFLSVQCVSPFCLGLCSPPVSMPFSFQACPLHSSSRWVSARAGSTREGGFCKGVLHPFSLPSPEPQAYLPPASCFALGKGLGNNAGSGADGLFTLVCREGG